MAEQLEQVDAFTLDQRTYSYGDVVRAAILRGESWRSPSTVDAETVDVRAQIVAFRRAHGLLSAQDYRGWLAQRNLETAAVEAYVRGDEPADPDRLRATLILSGLLRSWAHRLADNAAIATRQGTIDDTLDRDGHLRALHAGAEAFQAELLTEAALTRVITQHGLEWQRLDWDELELASEGAAREAALWMRVDGLAMADVAGLAHREPAGHSALYCDVPRGVSPLLAAGTGQLVGPLRDGEEWRLARLTARTPANRTDPLLRARAEQELTSRALERFRAGRVRWHVEL